MERKDIKAEDFPLDHDINTIIQKQFDQLEFMYNLEEYLQGEGIIMFKDQKNKLIPGFITLDKFPIPQIKKTIIKMKKEDNNNNTQLYFVVESKKKGFGLIVYKRTRKITIEKI